jgi:hypothetical protein
MGIVTVGFFLIRGLAGDFLSLRRCAFPWSPREEIPPIAAHPHPKGQSSAQEGGVSARLRRSPLHKNTGMRGSPPVPPGNQLTSDNDQIGWLKVPRPWFSIYFNHFKDPTYEHRLIALASNRIGKDRSTAADAPHRAAP